MGDELLNRKSDMDNINKIPAMEQSLKDFRESFSEFKEGWKDFQADIKPCINDYPAIKKDVSWLKLIFWRFEIPILLCLVCGVIGIVFKIAFHR